MPMQCQRDCPPSRRADPAIAEETQSTRPLTPIASTRLGTGIFDQ